MPDFTFGKRNRPSGGGGFDLFLKTFPDGQSRVACLEDNPEQWTNVFEHYDRKIGGANGMTYPCAVEEGAADCIGCSYPVEHPEWEDLKTHFPGLEWRDAMDARKKADPGWAVRGKSQKWVAAFIDPKDYVSIYKIGKNLWEDFCAQYSVLGTLLGNEWVVKREGKGFDTKHNAIAVPGEVRKPKAEVPTDQVISEVLGKKYAYALEQYAEAGIEPMSAYDPSQGSQAAPDPAPVESTGDPVKDAITAAKAASMTPPAESAAPEGFVPAEAGTGEIKDFLDGLEPPVEYAPRAPRPTLIKLAEKAMVERGIAPF